MSEELNEELHLEEEAEALPPENNQRSTRKKKLIMISGLVCLLIVAGIGGYLLLSGKQVQVKAMRRAGEKLTSGTDLQKAAYDSLKGSLDTPASNTEVPATNIGAGQSPLVNMAGVMPSVPNSSKTDPAKTNPAVQSGIAMTIAPPPEVVRENQNGSGQNSNSPKPTASTSPTPPVLASVVAKVKTDSSISFTTLPTKSEARNLSTLSNPLLTQRPEEKSIAPTHTISVPSFGAMLPVRLIGVLYTLRLGSMVRLEVTRDLASFKRGTIFVGTVQGAELDRAFVQIKGWIDPATNSFTKLEGELLGSDGGAGVRGKRRSVTSVWSKVLDRTAQAGTQILTGLLGRRGGSVIVATDPYGTYRSTRDDPSARQENRTFVEVTAGTVGFILITTLPSEKKAESLLAQTEETSDEVSDQEVATLLTKADPAQIRAALPRMNPELRMVAQAVLRELEAGK
jgi:hypothetical protein